MSSIENLTGFNGRADRPRPSRRAQGGWMGGTIPLGRLAGVEIGVTWTWLLIFGLVVASLAGGVFPSTNEGLATGTYIAMGVAAAVLFFASLLLHELGHAVQARREGMEISGITLWLLGGVARFTGMFPSPGAEFRIAIAGPLVTLVIGACLVVLGYAVALPSAVDGVVLWVGLTNVFVLVFNLLPAFPMDGGRILRSALWRLRGDLRWATRVAARVSRVLGALMIAAGLVTLLSYTTGGLWLVLIGWFVLAAGTAEARVVEEHEALAGLSVRDAMVRDPITVPSNATLQDVFDNVLSGHRHAVYPVVERGAVIGLLEARDLLAVPRPRWQSVLVKARTLPLSQAVVVDEGDDLAEALTRLIETDLRCALVLRDSRLAGLLSLSDVERLAAMRAGPPAG